VFFLNSDVSRGRTVAFSMQLDVDVISSVRSNPACLDDARGARRASSIGEPARWLRSMPCEEEPYPRITRTERLDAATSRQARGGGVPRSDG
jgi:hypothetical protein